MSIVGWAADRRAPDAVLDVEVLIEGRPVAAGRADLFRQDLADHGYGQGRHGFQIALGKVPRCEPRELAVVASTRGPKANGVALSISADARAAIMRALLKTTDLIDLPDAIVSMCEGARAGLRLENVDLADAQTMTYLAEDQFARTIVSFMRDPQPQP